MVLYNNTKYCKRLVKKERSVIRRINTGEVLSQAVVHNNIVYVCGMTATDRTKDVEDQTRQVFKRIDDVLALAGSDKSRILTATIWLADINARPAMTKIWKEWLPAADLPARAAMEAVMGDGILVEVMLQAACD
jgi:enamine deaminase RidA (YjgF/YER057c/UK114 family)